MKKIIYSLLVLAMTAFTFSSCEDVPAPYPIPEDSGNGGNTGTETDGTESNPYTVPDAIKTASGTSKFVKGYIVGFIPKSDASTYIENTIFAATGDGIQASNVVIAASADETNYNNCMAVALPVGDVRTALNLQDNPGNYKKEVILCGNIEKYFGAMGVKSVVWAKIDNKEVGTKPGTPDAPVAGEAKGTGTEADPFNSVAAYNKAKSLEADKATTEEYYIKGKITEFVPYKEDTGEFNATYGNASFKIADDANSTSFYIYRTYYFGGEKWKEGDTQLKVGDEVVVCSKLINFKGNTPETNQGGKLISINGKKGGGSVDPTPTPDPTPAGDGMGVDAIKSGLTSGGTLPVNGYGNPKQDVTNESTWVAWTYDNVSYKGAKICQATDANGGGIQVQGNKSDAASQGFIFNATAFSKEIKTITVYLTTAASSTYAPSYSLYAAKAANGRDTQVKGTSNVETGEKFKTYTEVYDMSSYNTKFFTLWNNTQGALYIEKIVVTLK